MEKACQEGVLCACVCVCESVHVYGPAERMNDVTDPCSTISPVDVSWQTGKQCSLFQPAATLHCY